MKLLKNKKGLTLIEVLATTAIISFIAILIFSIIQSSIDQRVKQTKETRDLFDISYALKVVTKDIRRAVNASATGTTLILEFPNGDEATYLLEDSQLKREANSGTEVITSGIGCAEFTGNNVISIRLSNTSNCSKGQTTKIHLRTGDE